MTFKTNASTVEAIQSIGDVSGFAAKAAAVLAFGCSSRRNASKAASFCSDIFTSSIEIQLPKQLQNRLRRIAKANRISESEFLSGCATAYAL